MAHTQKNIKTTFLAVLIIKLFVSIKNLAKNAVYRFIEAVLNEYDYCKKMIKNHFNKNHSMSAKEEERFQLSNSYWMCDKLFDMEMIT